MSESKLESSIGDARTASRDEAVRERLDVDATIEPHITRAISAMDGRSPFLAGMVRYHLGYANPDFSNTSHDVLRASRGKRLRPELALQACVAAEGDPRQAAPVAAAIELLHNFTLIHDDIQDRSETRRHRATVWKLWGIAQAINAGDSLFAAAHLPITWLPGVGVPAETALHVVEAFNRMTIEIVEGQVLDLSFEGRDDVSPESYFDMISGKTAAIVRFAAWAGALIAGRPEADAERMGAFGLALGLGYQIRDDSLGIWGDPETTGKSAADDIRQRKQSFPIVLLRRRATDSERRLLDQIYLSSQIDESGIATILDMLAAHDVRTAVATRTSALHHEARELLLAAGLARNSGESRLLAMVDQMALRAY